MKRLLLALLVIVVAIGISSCDRPQVIKKELVSGETISNFYYSNFGEGGDKIRRDAVELDPHNAGEFDIIDAEVEEALKYAGRGMGFIHTFWATKKQILKEKYGIDWRSPAELNPEWFFD